MADFCRCNTFTAMLLRRVDRGDLPAYLSPTASRETFCFDTTWR